MIFVGKSDERPAWRTRVKICGITHPDDAALAIQAGADALGLNFYPGSPRCLDPREDGEWLRRLPPSTPRVAVVVNASPEEIARLLGEGLADAVQLHGDEDAEFCRELAARGTAFIKAIRIRDDSALLNVERFGTDDLLVDAFHPKAYGGTGEAVDWNLAARFAERHRRTILAGGLRPDNVAAAIRQVRPYAVDVASGVERSDDPRRKDAEKMKTFFASVRTVDASFRKK